MSAKCDFCSSADPPWIFPSERFIAASVSEGPLQQGSSGGWAACDRCAELVERREWRQLARRCVDLAVTLRLAATLVGRKAVIARVEALHQEFATHRTGPRRAFG